MRSKTVQRIYRFSLSVKDANYNEVKGIVENLIGQGALSRVIRDGIRLVNDLSAGRVDVLLELYPWIREAICPPAPSNDDVLRELEAFRREFRERQTSQRDDIPDIRQNGFPAMSPAMKPSKHTLGQGVQFSAPSFDDDDTPLVLSAAIYQNTGENFAASLANL